MKGTLHRVSSNEVKTLRTPGPSHRAQHPSAGPFQPQHSLTDIAPHKGLHYWDWSGLRVRLVCLHKPEAEEGRQTHIPSQGLGLGRAPGKKGMWGRKTGRRIQSSLFIRLSWRSQVPKRTSDSGNVLQAFPAGSPCTGAPSTASSGLSELPCPLCKLPL